MRILIILLLLLSINSFAQKSVWDSLNIQYQLLQNDYHQFETIIKIKLPPYLTTHQVMQQIKLAVKWPNDPEPTKRIKVYVYPDDAVKGETSGTGGIYIPNKGYRWDLADWQPDTSIYAYQPKMQDKVVYNTLLDSLLTKGLYTLEMEEKNLPVKKRVAKKFDLTLVALDSIFYRVKWWHNLQSESKK